VYCSKCGNAMAAGSTFCSNCGQPAAPAAILSPALEPALAVPGGAFPVSVQPPVAVEAVPSYRFTLVYAGFWLRFVAYLIDALILGICLGILIGTIGAWLYHALLECSDWQGTAGKKAVGLKVTDLNGARVSFARASGRHFAKIISGLIPLGIGYIMAGFTERKQAIHDMVAACLVLRS
jgi:uncharacterized RDD family membrane protein YckC